MSVRKWRVTSDDSVAAPGSDSRNDMIDPEALGKVRLPVITKLAEAVAIVKTVARGAGMELGERGHERVALWALDLTNAYRELAAARHEWWLQQFVWHDGVRLDKRCLFGTRHLVDLFQRVSTFVMAAARRRIQLYDASHPYSAAWQEWQCRRRSCGQSESCAFSDIYLDDGFGLTCLGAGERMRGSAPRAGAAVTLLLEPAAGGVVLKLFPRLSRPEVHLAIVRATFQQAGWGIATDKVQLGGQLHLLGLGLSVEGDGALFVPEVKRQGLLRDIRAQRPDTSVQGVVPREAVEKLVGRLTHAAIVAPEGNAHLQPLYRVRCATYSRVRKSRMADGSFAFRRVAAWPRKLRVGGKSARACEYQRALDWWQLALEHGVSAPLAPKLVFPCVGSPGCILVFTDAA